MTSPYNRVLARVIMTLALLMSVAPANTAWATTEPPTTTNAPTPAEEELESNIDNLGDVLGEVIPDPDPDSVDDSVDNAFARVSQAMLTILMYISIIYIIWYAIRWVTAGNEKKEDAAKRRLKKAAIVLGGIFLVKGVLRVAFDWGMYLIIGR